MSNPTGSSAQRAVAAALGVRPDQVAAALADDAVRGAALEAAHAALAAANYTIAVVTAPAREAHVDHVYPSYQDDVLLDRALLRSAEATVMLAMLRMSHYPNGVIT